MRVIMFSLLAVLLGMAFAPSPRAESADAAFANEALSGKVLEAMNSGGYTYLLLKSRHGKIWVAMPEEKLARKGVTLATAPGMVVRNFTAKSLNRTFDRIVFCAGLNNAQKWLNGEQDPTEIFADALAAEGGGDARPLPFDAKPGAAKAPAMPARSPKTPKAAQ